MAIGLFKSWGKPKSEDPQAQEEARRIELEILKKPFEEKLSALSHLIVKENFDKRVDIQPALNICKTLNDMVMTGDIKIREEYRFILAKKIKSAINTLQIVNHAGFKDLQLEFNELLEEVCRRMPQYKIDEINNLKN